jgi:hypothetical protein
MMPGDNYPELNAKNGGTAVPVSNFNTGNDHAYIKKYVIGSPDDNGGGTTMAAYENTYMLRLAEVYLNYAEAILGNSASTTDATALKYVNAVRARAGVPALTSLSFNDIYQERKIEFAFEGLQWNDWVHWYYFAPAKAMAYFSTQDRGHYNIKYNSPGNYTVTYTGTTYPVTDATVYLPWPEAELELAPHLADAPVAFDFSKLPNY